MIPLIAAVAGAGYAIANKLAQNKTDNIAGGLAEEERYGIEMKSFSKVYSKVCAEKGNLDAPGGPAREARARHFQDLLDNRSDFSKIFDWRGDYEKVAASVKADIKQLALDGQGTKFLSKFSAKLGYAISIGESQNSGRVQMQEQRDNVASGPNKPMYADKLITEIYRLTQRPDQMGQSMTLGSRKALIAYSDSVAKYSDAKIGNGINFAAQGRGVLFNKNLDKVILAELSTLKAAGRGETSEAIALKQLREAFRIFKSTFGSKNVDA